MRTSVFCFMKEMACKPSTQLGIYLSCSKLHIKPLTFFKIYATIEYCTLKNKELSQQQIKCKNSCF